jgi:nitric oxide reductase NorD protein
MSSGLALFEVERALALFAQGISGQPYQIQPESDAGPQLQHTSGNALHSSTTLYLPDSFGPYPERDANLGGYRLLALHQLCYRECGSHLFSVVRAREQCPELKIRPLVDLGPRESDLTLLFAHFGNPTLARGLFRIIEAIRIDQHMLRCYPGITPHYRRFAKLEIQQRIPDSIDGLAPLLDAVIAMGLGADRVSLTERDATGLLTALAELVDAVAHPDADVYDSSTALTHSYQLIERHGFDTRWSIEGPTGDPRGDPLESSPTLHGDPPLEWLQRDARLGDWQDEVDALQLALEELEGFDLTDPEGTPTPGAASAAIPDDVNPGGRAAAGEDGTGELRPADLEVEDRKTTIQDAHDQLVRRIDMERSAVRNALGGNAHAGPSFLYDEWDEPGQRYLRAWCRLFEERLMPGPEDDSDTLLRNVAALRRAVRQQFEQLRPQAYSRVRKLAEGDELDWDQLIAYRVDRHREASPDDRVYQRHDRKARDVSALFLVDLSASTDDPLLEAEPGAVAAEANLRDPFDDPLLWAPDGKLEAEPPRRRIIDVQREALLLMADALDRLGDRFGVFGFSGYGRDCVDYYIAKEFTEPWTTRAVKALAAMKPRRSTRMGPAIRHSTRKLMRAGGALKVLIVISDGFPQDCDYGPDRGSHDYGVADTAKALREAERAGVSTFCITVDRSGHDYLKRMCDEARYMVIDDIETLPAALSKVYTALTTK